MPKRSSKRDANEIAKSIVDQVADDVEPVEEPAKPEKNLDAEVQGIVSLASGRKATVNHGFERTAQGSALS